MKRDDLKFQIDQLRKDKIIYATEATATNVLCLLIYIFAAENFSGFALTVFTNGAIVLAVGYSLYMGIGNAKRLLKVKKLEKQLGN